MQLLNNYLYHYDAARERQREVYAVTHDNKRCQYQLSDSKENNLC